MYLELIFNVGQKGLLKVLNSTSTVLYKDFANSPQSKSQLVHNIVD